ncbi:MAG: sigma-70 family RNA polymerase sigma factor [Planctomycetota bacterium]
MQNASNRLNDTANDLNAMNSNTEIDTETNALWALYGETRDIALRNRLIEQFISLPEQVARRMMKRVPASILLDELVSAGYKGLIDAVENYDVSLGTSFRAYAKRRISGAILDELRSQDILPKEVRFNVKSLIATRDEMIGRQGYTPSDEELAEKLGFTSNYVRFLDDCAKTGKQISYDQQVAVSDDGDSVQLSRLIDSREPDPSEMIQKKETVERLMRGLSDREKEIIRRRYFENATMGEIGAVFGLTESRICQLHLAALKFLEKKVVEFGL